MKNVYIEKFSALIDDMSTQTGIRFDPMVEAYVSVLLADHVEKTDFFSEPIAIRYMQIDQMRNAKELGDNCLVMVGMFPNSDDVKNRYVASVGIGSYFAAADATGSMVFEALYREFDDVSLLLNHIRPVRFW